MRSVPAVLTPCKREFKWASDVSANTAVGRSKVGPMRDFVSASSPRWRGHARPALSLLLISFLTLGSALVYTATANAVTALGASAAERGRYLGAAVGTAKFNDSTYMAVRR